MLSCRLPCMGARMHGMATERQAPGPAAVCLWGEGGRLAAASAATAPHLKQSQQSSAWRCRQPPSQGYWPYSWAGAGRVGGGVAEVVRRGAAAGAGTASQVLVRRQGGGFASSLVVPAPAGIPSFRTNRDPSRLQKRAAERRAAADLRQQHVPRVPVARRQQVQPPHVGGRPKGCRRDHARRPAAVAECLQVSRDSGKQRRAAVP